MAREPVSFDFVHQYEGGHRSRPVAEDVDPTHERRAADRVARADRDPTEAEVVISEAEGDLQFNFVIFQEGIISSPALLQLFGQADALAE